jgi:uncharacterized protein YuzE
MALTADVKDFIKLVPAMKQSPSHSAWISYDEEADTLYISFKKPAVATDSEITNDDLIIRYEGEAVVGITVLHASKR